MPFSRIEQLHASAWVTCWRREREPVHCLYSAFRQKFPKLWTSVAHSFLQQIAENKSWAHPKATTLPRIYKVEMEHASLLFYLAKPQCGGVLGCDLRHCTSEPFDFWRFVEACRAYSQYSAWSRCCRSADRCPAITSVDRLGSVALRSGILCLPFFHLFDFFDISKCSHRFHSQAQKDHWCVRPFLAKNNSLPLFMIQSRQDTHTQKLKLRP